MSYDSLKEINGRIAELSRKGHQVYDEAGPDMDFSKVKSLNGDTTQKIAELKAINDELSDLHKKLEVLSALAKSRKELDAQGEAPEHKNDPAPVAKKSIGMMIKESGLFKDKNKTIELPDVDLKTEFTTTAGWAPQSLRLPGYIPSPVRAPSVLNYIPQYNTNQHAIVYMLETTYTATNAVEKAEGAALGEVALVLTETTRPIEKIGAYIPVTDVQLEDEANIDQYLTDRLMLMIRNRVEAQILVGTGVTPLLLGTDDLPAVQSQAKGADATPDTFFKAMTLVRHTGFAEPSVIFIEASDWQDIKLLRTADGIYIFGNPTDAGPERLWGLPVCVTQACTAGTGYIGDYANYSAFYWRKGMEVAMSNAYTATSFIEGKQAVRITTRCSMVHFRETAFVKVTGI